MATRASASSQCGTATRTMSTPAATREAICCRVALMSAVFVVVIDWIEIGASPPIFTEPIWIWRVSLRGVGISISSLGAGNRSAARAYSPNAWKVMVRSLGSSISKKIRRCHVPNPGSPPTTGMACDVAESSMAFT